MRTTKAGIVGLLTAAALTTVGGHAGAADEYQWGSVATGGGGYFCGIDWAPTAPNRPWISSDVSGPWQREPGDSRFDLVGLNSFSPYPMGNATGVAFDPVDGNIVYAAFGQNMADRYERGVYRSRDAGKTWTRIFDKWSSPCDEARFSLPGIAVDSLDRRIIYVGTNHEGLWRTLDDGVTWNQVAAPPTGGNAPAVRALLIDGRERSDNRSKTVWMGWAQMGPDDTAKTRPTALQVSHDGGNTFTPFSLPGGEKTARRLCQGSDGRVWVATSDSVVMIENDKAKVMTPPHADHISGVDVDPKNPKHIVVIGTLTKEHGGHWTVFRSRDGGVTWLPPLAQDWGKKTGIETGDVIGWYAKRHGLNMAGVQIRFDPADPKKVWLADAFMVWTARDIWASPTVWDAQQAGLDNIVTIMMACPPAAPAGSAGTTGPLFAGVSDVRGFRFDSPMRVPADYVMGEGEWNTYVNGFTWCETKPLVQMVAKFGGVAHILRSTDGGLSWNELRAPKRKVSHGGAKILLSATDENRVAYFPANKQTPWFSADGGQSWEKSTTTDGGEMPWFSSMDWAYNFAQQFAADTVDGSTFYAYRDGDQGELWISRDGAKTYACSLIPLPKSNPQDDIAPVAVWAVPGRAGHVWLALANGGVWRSTDFGQHIEQVPGILGSRPLNISFGKEAPGRRPDQPTIYVQGCEVANGPVTIRRSIDDGQTWERIADNPGLWGRSMVADRQRFGRLYLGSIPHASIIYGQINATAPKLTVQPTVNGVAGVELRIPVTVTDAETDPEALRLRVIGGQARAVQSTKDASRWEVILIPTAGTTALELIADDGGLVGSKNIHATVQVIAP